MCLRQGCLLSMHLYNIAAELLANLINAEKRIKVIQIGDHEIQIVNFTDITTIFLRDITYLNGMQVVLRLYEKDKVAQRKFFQNPSLYAGAYKNRIQTPGPLE